MRTMMGLLMIATAFSFGCGPASAQSMGVFPVVCTKHVSGDQIDFRCKGSGGSATGRVTKGQRIYAHWAAKPQSFSCKAGFGVPGAFSTGSISC